ncbi:SURF1 family protein [Pseudidiomarina woesei]|uniref:SURF1-like protein n=1 Tax=Pseudidiomarina woesei TaxID=1381080 RepID=A0A0K6HBT7_9GAMM|nr:SURF1 family protein [Pseudidiomarina woesei]CUA88221.1 Cytochrome oxidase assembly protein ShyY1 [Pseudidiomarina woesei]
MRKSIRISKLIGAVLTVLAISFLVKLGFWQLERAEQKQLFFEDYANRSEQVVELNQLHSPSTRVPRFSQVRIRGQFKDDYLLLDNQIHEGEVGYHVIGLLQAELANTERVVMVNMGWVALGASRDQRPKLTMPQQPLSIQGYFYQPELSSVWGAGKYMIENDQHPVRVQQLDAEAIAQTLQLPIEPYVVLLSENEELGWPRAWQPQVMTPEKHRAYAWQWFSLALACLLVFWFASRSKKITTEE